MFGAVVTNDPFLIVDHARDQSIRPLVISCEILLVKPYGKWIFGRAAMLLIHIYNVHIVIKLIHTCSK